MKDLLPKFHAQRIWAALVLLLFVCPALSGAAEDVKPPWGLQWGERSDYLARLLTSSKAKIVDKHNIDGREAWTVEGLIQAGLKRTVFYFTAGELVEVELQYQNAAWDSNMYDDFMASVRRKIEEKFGTGQLIARTKQQEGDVTQTIVGYKWTQTNTVIQLFYYSAEKEGESYRTVSVHYKVL